MVVAVWGRGTGPFVPIVFCPVRLAHFILQKRGINFLMRQRLSNLAPRHPAAGFAGTSIPWEVPEAKVVDEDEEEERWHGSHVLSLGLVPP